MNPAWMWTVGLVVIHGQFTLNQTTCVKNVLATFGVDFLGQTKTCMNGTTKRCPPGVSNHPPWIKNTYAVHPRNHNPTYLRRTVPILVWQFYSKIYIGKKNNQWFLIGLNHGLFQANLDITCGKSMDRPPADPQRSKYFLQRLRGPPGRGAGA